MSKSDQSIENMSVKKKSSAYKGSTGAGKSVEKSTGKQYGKTVEKSAGKQTGKTAEKSTGKQYGKAVEKSANKQIGKTAEKSTGKYTGKPANKGADKKSGKSASKPWEQMNKKEPKKEVKKVVSEYKSFLYMIPKKITVADMAKCLDFIPKSDVEVWLEEGVLEVTVDGSAITFEDMAESLDTADMKVIKELGQAIVYACDYESTKADTVKKMMQAFLDKFGGKMGSDTEDFEPFIQVDEI